MLKILRVTRQDNYTHYAFSIQDDFDAFVEKIKLLGVTEWKINKREGKSFYFWSLMDTRWKSMTAI